MSDVETRSDLIENRGLQNEIAQIRAKSTLIEVSSEMPAVAWTFDLHRVLRNASALLLLLESELREQNYTSEVLQARAHRLGQLWESLSRLEETQNKTVSLINAMLSYELAGYQANSICIAKMLQTHATKIESGRLTDPIATFYRRRFFQAKQKSLALFRQPRFSNPVDPTVLTLTATEGLVGGALIAASDFFLAGDYSMLKRAVAMLTLAKEGFTAAGEIHQYTLVSLLLQTLPHMESRSTWKVLIPANP